MEGQAPSGDHAYHGKDRRYNHRYEGFVGPREEEGVQVDYISECSLLNCVPNVICRLEGESMKIWVEFTNGVCIEDTKAAVAGHDNDGQVQEGNDLRQWARPDYKFHGVVNDANCVRNIGRLRPV